MDKENKGIRMVCKAHGPWTYKGISGRVYAPCPNCHSSIKVPERYRKKYDVPVRDEDRVRRK
jgi:hypothetical protein